jgi:diguanylate cyclase (GGDEF)-like protein
LDRNEIAGRPEISRLRGDVLRQMGGLNVVKVKIYNLDGLTVFSTDATQIGEDKSDNAGFRHAKAGETASDITFRHQFDAFEQVIVDRNLVFSYIPVRTGAGAPVEAVFEVYSDVTNLVDKLEKTQWQIVASVLGVLALLYAFLFLIVRRADRIINAETEVERRANEERLRHQAYHDSLTGLPNRTSLIERVGEAIKRGRRNGETFAVLFLDLDSFKDINDSLGHSVGDLMLQAVAERLQPALREQDTVARLGGDEFVVTLLLLKRTEHAAVVAEKLLVAVSGTPYSIEGRELSITASIGISVFPDDGKDVNELIKNADAALYHAKKMGRNNFQFYAQDIGARAFAILSMEHSLRRALERGEFLLHFQPQMDLGSGTTVGAEALIRWEHPEMGMVSPAEFIPIAEERGLIVAIGDWVLNEACRQNREWQQAGLAAIPVGVNLSALQFRDKNLIDKIAAALHKTGLSAAFLEIELTESAVMQDSESAIATMRAMKEMGLHLSIDDFGTGYSSLNYLKRFPLDKLKIDRSFVRGLPHDADDAAIANAVLGMARALRLKVIAEGVESGQQAEFLRQHGCDEIQGYYFGRPMPAEQFARFLQEQHALLH